MYDEAKLPRQIAKVNEMKNDFDFKDGVFCIKKYKPVHLYFCNQTVLNLSFQLYQKFIQFDVRPFMLESLKIQ